jgi:hypothetical protein
MGVSFYHISDVYVWHRWRGNPAPYFGDYPADYFDFIIIDECHRGGANDEGTGEV